jgi:hypothetical protein
MSNHHQIPSEKINSCITLSLKSEGRTLDNSDYLIEELTEIQHKEALLCNGTVENCSPGSIFKTTVAVSLNSTESNDSNGHKMDFLKDSETSAAVLGTSHSTPHNTDLQSASPDLYSSSELIQSSRALDTSSDKLQSLSLQNMFHALNGTDQPSPSTESSDAITPSGQNDLSSPNPIQTSQSVLNVPTHTRSLSQTTSQLTNLKESTKSDNLGDTSHMNNVLLGSNVKKISDSYPVNKSGSMYLKNISNMLKISSSNEDELLPSQDMTTSTGHGTAPDNSDANEETAVECSPNQSQCSGAVSYRSSLESDIESPYLTHSLCPGWKLDRRGSGHLYWRRDSSTLNGVDPSSRVKFRYDIEVREFESRSSEAEDLPEGDDGDMYDDNDDDSEIEIQGTGKRSVRNSKTFVNKREEFSSLGSTAVIGGVAIIAIIVMASYRWLLGALSVI